MIKWGAETIAALSFIWNYAHRHKASRRNKQEMIQLETRVIICLTYNTDNWGPNSHWQQTIDQMGGLFINLWVSQSSIQWEHGFTWWGFLNYFTVRVFFDPVSVSQVTGQTWCLWFQWLMSRRELLFPVIIVVVKMWNYVTMLHFAFLWRNSHLLNDR